MTTQHWDAVVIGTGFGGAMTAYRLVLAGHRVLLIERGRHVDRDDSAWDVRAIHREGKYHSDIPYEADRWIGRGLVYPSEAVGGNSVFYGAASLRMRESDFDPTDRFEKVPVEFADASWPIEYADLEPYYSEAERLLGVHGEAGRDPTEPPRSESYSAPPPPLASPARRVAEAAEELGLSPFHIPLAINFSGEAGRASCIRCLTCDLFPCKISAKNDLAVTVLPQSQEAGATILARTVARRLIREGSRITGVECIDRDSGEKLTVYCDICVVSAGAIASPRLLLLSGLDQTGRGGEWIGRYLLRHCSGIVMGVFFDQTNPEKLFHKQIAITDFYGGKPGSRPAGPWGMIQGLQVPPPEFIRMEAPFPISTLGALTQSHHIYLLCIAEDAPDPDNRVQLDSRRTDEYGLPLAHVTSRYSSRDRKARSALYREGARILRHAGALLRVRKPINTFSHAVGTCRFGKTPEKSALDPWCRLFGMDNLFVVDGSFMPSSGGVNPSLTIAANALRVGDHIAGQWDEYAGGANR